MDLYLPIPTVVRHLGVPFRFGAKMLAGKFSMLFAALSKVWFAYMLSSELKIALRWLRGECIF
jgi:hypothetical protein